MELNPSKLNEARSDLLWARRSAEAASGRIKTQMGRDFSGIAGVSEAGEIHGRAIQGDPASAKSLLDGFGDQLDWALNVLESGASAFESQDDRNSRGLEISDIGGYVSSQEMEIQSQPDHGYMPLSYVPPLVMVGSSMVNLQSSFGNTKLNQLGQLMTDWSDLSTSVQSISDSLIDIAETIEREHDSEFTVRAAFKIRAMAGDAQQFVANAQQMVGKTGALSAQLPIYNLQMLADVSSMHAIPDLAAKTALEAIHLTKWQATLQNWVTQSLPNQQSLTEPPKSYGAGGSIDIGLETIAGTGTRYSTDEVVWPEEMQDAIKSGEIGPGSFGVADGELVALENIDQGLVDQVRQAINDRNESLYGGGRLQEFLNSGMQTLEEAGTHTAGVQGSTGGTFNGGVNPAMGQAASGSGATGGSNLGFGSGSGALGTLGGVGGPSALGNSNTGLGSTGVRSGIPGTGLGSARGSGGGVSGGRAFGAAGGEGSSRVLGGSGDTAGRAGANTGASSQGAGSGAAGAGSNGQHGRGMGSMMAPGGAARNQEKKKSGMIKAVTSRVEADKNRRDLLGEPPAALPGPIGDWARQ